MFAPTVNELVQRYGNRIVVHYRNFQLAKHPQARTAAIAVEAARRQGKFFAMHRLVFGQVAAEAPQRGDEILAALQHGREPPGSAVLAPEALRRYAGELGLDLTRYDADVKDPVAAARVDADYADGEKRELDHVPALYINDAQYDGEMSGRAIAAAIDARL
jgi:predicted DsbA family dithiol-disulfide isomerase